MSRQLKPLTGMWQKKEKKNTSPCKKRGCVNIQSTSLHCVENTSLDHSKFEVWMSLAKIIFAEHCFFCSYLIY